MAELYLIRHGQASFGAEDYDQLSPLGQSQCELLGSFFARFMKDSHVFTGTLKRHHQSMTSFFLGFHGEEGDKSQTVAENVIHRMPELDEFDHEEVLFKAFPEFKSKSALAAELAKSEYPKKRFHELFELSLARWISGEQDQDYKESWAAFQQRVSKGFQKLKQFANENADELGKKPLVVFTSGGPIAAIVKEVMGLSEKATFELNENLANSGVSRILFSNDKQSISYINNYSHLQDKPNLISYR